MTPAKIAFNNCFTDLIAIYLNAGAGVRNGSLPAFLFWLKATPTAIKTIPDAKNI